MLHTKSISLELLELLNWIMREPAFGSFNLVGGTALALQIGHRKSVDIDLFGKCEIQETLFLGLLQSFGKTNLIKKSTNILVCMVNGIKVDFVNYGYPFIESVLVSDGIRLASPKDIAAMKLNAIAGRGSKKDFIDLYYLLKFFTINEMMEFYLKKYKDGSEFMVRKSLVYFDDADYETAPYVFEDITWEEMKKNILQKV